MQNMFLYSFLGFIVPTAVCFIPALLTSYYVYQKMLFSKTIKVIFFIPGLMSGIAMATISRYMFNIVFPEILEKLAGIPPQPYLEVTANRIPIMLGINVWRGLCGASLLYMAAMAAVPQSVVESARIDGAGRLREFWSIIIPSIFPTITVITVTGITGLLISDLGTYDMFGRGIDFQSYTVGYYTFDKLRNADYPTLPHLSALGILLSAITVPVVFLTKFLMEKIGPSTD